MLHCRSVGASSARSGGKAPHRRRVSDGKASRARSRSSPARPVAWDIATRYGSPRRGRTSSRSPLRGDRIGQALLSRRDGGRPCRDGERCRGARPKDLRREGRRARLRGVEGGARRGGEPTRSPRHRLCQRRHLHEGPRPPDQRGDSVECHRYQPDRRLAHLEGGVIPTLDRASQRWSSSSRAPSRSATGNTSRRTTATRRHGVVGD